MPKHFIVTVDTEGDNLWRHKDGTPILTHNAEHIRPFQELNDTFGFKPVYLTNYEMANSEKFVEEAKQWLKENRCEIGVHLHAWNNPPEYELTGKYKGKPYLIEYPEKVMREKFKVIYDLICKKFDIIPVSHRSGRWAMNETYFKILNDFGIKVDCSVTPTINWNHSKGITIGGTDYTDAQFSPYFVENVLEVPVSVRRTNIAKKGSLSSRIRVLFKPRRLWLRPAGQSLDDMKQLVDIVEQEPNTDYLEFMIHSSELMLGGSPFFKKEEEIDKFFQKIKDIFGYVYSKGYEGATLAEYYDYFTR